MTDNTFTDPTTVHVTSQFDGPTISDIYVAVGGKLAHSIHALARHNEHDSQHPLTVCIEQIVHDALCRHVVLQEFKQDIAANIPITATDIRAKLT